MRKWKIASTTINSSQLTINKIVNILLANREIKTKKQKEEFLHPELSKVTPASVGIKKTQLNKAIKRIQKAIEKQEQIVVFGDYDVDGICGSAILWETLHALGAKALPYIPHRIDEGYGLSPIGISNIKSQISNIQLIITVDNGIVANEAVEFANKNGIDVIITDHHLPSKKLPKAQAIVHTTQLCGTGVAYLLAKEISNFKFQISNKYQTSTDHLALVALATVADLVPLHGANRTLLVHGLKELRKTNRPGLKALFEEAMVKQEEIDTYHIGFIIAPRLNAAGRMEYAMDSLRLLCTKNKEKATLLAQKLGRTNRDRQLLTQETVLHAKSTINSSQLTINPTTASGQAKNKLIFISHESYQQGVIGLVAGKLVEEFYRPSIVISKGEKYSKASARSISGFNIIEFIRSASEHLVDAGGHPMAAGFTVETEKIQILEKVLTQSAVKLLDESLLTRTLRIDCELSFSYINSELYAAIQQLAPFGIGNPEPVFMTKNVVIDVMRLVGSEKKHLKLIVNCQMLNVKFDAIAFGIGERANEFHIGDTVDIAYTISEDTWLARRSLGEGGNGNRKLQLKIKDIKHL